MSKKPKLPEVQAVAVGKNGDVEDISLLEDQGIAFDPTRMPLDLERSEKRRVTALMMAIQAYNNIIIKDAEMYIAVSRDSARTDGPTIKPATMEAMVRAAIQFDHFIAGHYDVGSAQTDEPETSRGVESQAPANSVEKD